MRRTIILGGAALIAAFALGCSADETKPAASGSAAPAAAAPAAPVEPAGAPVAMVDMYVWDPANGAEPDLSADATECQAQISAQGLAAVAQHIECMRQKGWTTRPPTP